MENKDYILKLKEQFKQATGTTTRDINSPEFEKEFYDWIYRREISNVEIARMLKKMEIDIDCPEVAEINKGKIDSIAYSFDDTTIISPYFKGVRDTRDGYGQIITDELNLETGKPLIINRDNSIPDIWRIKSNEIKTYMTHNPYNKSDITKLMLLQSNPDIGIIFSVYGYIHDKDKDEKLKMLKDLKEKCLYPETLFEEYFTSGDKYYSILGTDMYEKKYKKRIR